MSRRRNFIRGGYYHVYSRGSRKEVLFIDFSDYEYFLKKCNQFNINIGNKIVQYCLMPNHFHLLIKAKSKSSVPKFMHKLCTGYAMRFCKRYAQVGSVFQGRYQAKQIDTIRYLIWLSRYIHRNPLDLKLNDNSLLKYPWSSLSQFLMLQKNKGFMEVEKSLVLKYFHNIKSYENFLLISDEHAKEWVEEQGPSFDLV